MKLYNIFYASIDTSAKFKTLAPEESEELLEKYGQMTKRDYISMVINICVYNFKTDIAQALRLLSKPNADEMIMSLYNGCIMLNPILDIDTWMLLTQSYNLFMEKEPISSLPDEHIMGMLTEAPQNSRKKSNKPFSIPFSKYVNLQRHLNDKVIGQPEAIEQISSSLKRAQAYLNDPEKPIGVFLFAGPSGVGKTLVAKELQKYLFEQTDLIRIDCGEYQHKHENQKLIGCFAQNTKVWMADGTQKNIQDVVVGDQVVTHLGNKKKVLMTHKYENTENLVSIESFGSTDKIICTPSHEFFSIVSARNESVSVRHQNKMLRDSCVKTNLDWNSAKDLQKGDWLAVPKPITESEYLPIYDLKDFIPLVGKHTRYKYDEKYIWAYESIKANRFIAIDENFSRLAGYYVSEGGSSKNKKRFDFTFNIREQDYVKEVIELVKKVFGLNTYTYIDKSYRGSCIVQFHNRVVTNFLSELFGDHTNRKKIPATILNSSESNRYALLETAMLGDGCQVVKGRTDYSTVSPDLYSGLLMLIRSLGFNPYTSLETRTDSTNQPRYRIYISGQEQLNQFNSMTSDLMFCLLPDGKRSIRNIESDDEYTYYKINKIENVPSQDYVFDLTVEEDTSYCIASGIAVHNSAPGYVGFEEGGQLTKAVTKNPNTVVLIDEAEKAHPDFWNTFLKVFDDGYLTDNKGNNVSFKNTIIIITSNLGNDKVSKETYARKAGFNNTIKDGYKSKTIPNRELVVRETEEEMRKFFKPEFMNRLDDVVIFNHLSDSDFHQIAELEMLNLSNKLSKQQFDVSWNEDVLGLLSEMSGVSIEGARGMSRVRRDKIENPLADLLLNRKYPKGTIFSITVQDAKFVIN